jgi:superoxide dismutase, Fe-Mn family
MQRRSFIKNSILTSVGVGLMGAESLTACSSAKKLFVGDEFTLPKLPYNYDALEPYIDKMTMEIHHTKHHQAYINNLNKALAGKEKNWSNLHDICKNIGTFNSDTIRNNAGGHWNHSFFWEIMKPAPATQPSGDLATAINTAFGSFDKMKETFNDAAMKRFGSGWAWLVLDDKGKLQIGSTPNQDNPLMDISNFKGKPLLGLDVWEHAYYLKYQNKRKDYTEAWWNLVNWNKVAEGLK